MRRDKKRRALFDKFEGERLRWKTIAKSAILPKEITNYAKEVLHNKFPRDSSITRIRNRCNLTGRPRGLVRQYGISRIKFRELADSGKLAGVTRSSW
ncbi:uncharacterized protein TRIADDRAFT_34345 [Trichoplax adhaerens]|uniref:28S ribosomal protein S14, mitochondrial n=1 Tax=Trichoplax adhaerens TaxID=10228 RepID=B3S005_TRIAD|nr:hypothetical protein TRIADDRAFT_26263 [Trichoplax adhaerens]XP_002118526.1 hypothetical protein TRIADDRAFT_34345 [Trichoplax adhaerens]EDV18988.1 hypothetical protein TRIADDRAFT_34345 [Trichoplax adhaerens]EDV23923.1 hypothetical protein TRIADDRAFT_26263 [Trichoplax adhaerens]|eukprot:XP_002113449.1 hypothetical protein TRIADDRAFT_26263 [Trichoplax adhaerens]